MMNSHADDNPLWSALRNRIRLLQHGNIVRLASVLLMVLLALCLFVFDGRTHHLHLHLHGARALLFGGRSVAVGGR